MAERPRGTSTRPCACGCGVNVPGMRYACQLATYIVGHSPVGYGDQWSEAEIAYLRINYDRMTRSELALAMNRSAESVKSYAMKVLGLRKGGRQRTLAAHFDYNTPLRPDGLCWPWQGNLTVDGYGVFTCGEERWLAHRASVYLRDGHLARSADVLHRCDYKPCANPSHLYLGDDSANQRDILSRTFRRGQRLTPDDVRTIRQRFLSGASKHDLAEEYGCVVSNIHALLIGKSWSWVQDGSSA